MKFKERNPKQDVFLIVDTETTVNNHVVDMGLVLCNRKGEIIRQEGFLIKDFYETEELFFDKHADRTSIWSWNGLRKRKEAYTRMLDTGERMLVSVNGLNKWLDRLATEYKKTPMVTAYNLVFDMDKCRKSNIDFSKFEKKFCLWKVASYVHMHTKEYKNFVLMTHSFNAPTQYGNMSYKTNAEVMARFVLKSPHMEDEPHTALEDARDYELPILIDVLNRKQKMTKNQLLEIDRSFSVNWKDTQVRDHFISK